MRGLLILVLGLTSSLGHSDTVAVENFLYDGSSNIQEITLNTQKTKTEYRDIPVPATCYRTEPRQVCQQNPPRCTTVCNRFGECRNTCVPGGVSCHIIPVRVPYACTRIERRPFQVHDYDVETRVQFQFNASELSDYVNENFSIRVQGESEKLSVVGSKNYFLLLEHQSKKASMSANIKYIDLIYKIKVVPATQAKSVLENGIHNVNLSRGILSFNLGAGFDIRNFSQQIRIYQNRRLGRDPLLLDKYLGDQELNIQSTANASIIYINLRELGINLPSNLRVILNTQYLINEDQLLNKNEITTKASSNWVFR